MKEILKSHPVSAASFGLGFVVGASMYSRYVKKTIKKNTADIKTAGGLVVDLVNYMTDVPDDPALFPEFLETIEMKSDFLSIVLEEL